MNRKLKTGGVVLFSLMATMWAVSATVAQAGEFHTEEKHTVTTTDTTEAIWVLGIQIYCKTNHSETTMKTESTGEAAVSPEYTGCVILGSETPLVPEFGGCIYVLTGETDESEHGELHIECPEGEEIEFKVTALKLNCVNIPPQTVTGVHYTNTGSGSSRDIAIDSTLSGIQYETSALCGGEAGENGTYSDEGELRANGAEEQQVGLWFE